MSEPDTSSSTPVGDEPEPGSAADTAGASPAEPADGPVPDGTPPQAPVPGRRTSVINGQTAARARLAVPVTPTKEHRRFLEFAEAVRRKRYIGLCFGAPGVGKTESARAYTRWDQLAPHLDGSRASGSDPADAPVDEVLSARAVMYTPRTHATPQHLDKEIGYLCDRLGWTVELMLQTGRSSPTPSPTMSVPDPAMHVELLVVDEAERLKTSALETLRDYHDRTGIGLILIGMPGIEKRLARYPQLYSRVGFVHHYKPLSVEEQAFVLARQWPHLGLDNTDDFTTAEAVAAITRITSGNFRLTTRLVDQIERVLEINQMTTVTKEVVEAARENLVIGIM